MKKEWFGSWFDSPYYHILYQHRNDSEAKQCIDAIVNYVQPHTKARILDVACGRGRHAHYLSQKGFDVTGIDLSAQSIAFAQKKQTEKLHYFQHDMREVFQPEAFEVVLNLFTSFGYFDNDTDNQRAAAALANNLKKGGYFVLDFFNADWVEKTLIPYQEKTEKGILFKIRKEIEAGFVVKSIDFEVEDHPYHFQERVRLLRLPDLMAYFSEAGLTLEAHFGNYALQPFDAAHSERLILVMRK